MSDLNKNDIRNISIIVILVICAVGCNITAKYDIVTGVCNTLLSVIRAGIYMGLVMAWGIAVKRRILNIAVRRYLMVTAALLLFWNFVRSCKYIFLSGLESAGCICWYCYYIPLILVPLMGMFAVLCQGKPESYTIPGKLKFLYVPASILILLVMTNNGHQLVFSFPESDLPPWDDYRYETGYYMILIWIAAEVAAFFAVLMYRSRIPGKRRRIWAPLIPVTAAMVYSAGYIAGFPPLYAAVNDMTVVFSLLIMAVFETCIITGMIQSNTHHDELFRCSTLGAQITDKDYAICYMSDTARVFGREILKEAEKHPVDLGTERLSGAAVRGGHVFWLDDVSKVKELLEELKKTGEKLSENNSIIKADVELREKKTKTYEQVRLYDSISRQAAPQIENLEKLLSSSGQTENDKVLAHICVISAFIKRLGNLLLLGEESYHIPARETGLCLQESMENLKLCSVACSLSYECEGIVTKDTAVLIYSAFEQIIETALPDMTALMADLKTKNGNCILVLNISCEGDPVISCLKELNGQGLEAVYTEQDGDMRIVIRCQGRGDML